MKKQAIMIVILVLFLAGCSAQLVRVPQGGMADTAPEIHKLIDLGSAGVPLEGRLNKTESDGMFIGGEWVAVIGKGLNTERTRLMLDTVEVPIMGGIEGGGLLFRLPRDLKFRHTYSLQVETPLGSATTNLPVTNLLIMSDPRQDRVIAWKTSSDKEQIFEEEFAEIDCPAAGPSVLASTGGLMYVTSFKDKQKQLKTLHLGAKGAPREISSTGFEAKFDPKTLLISSNGTRCYLLTSGELLVFDLSEPEHPRFVTRYDLPVFSKDSAPGYRDLVMLANGSIGATLDETSNQLLVIDFSQLDAHGVLTTSVFPASSDNVNAVGLLADPSAPNKLSVLVGLDSQQMRLGISSLWSDKPDQAVTTRTSLIRMEWKDNKLVPLEQVYLPEGILPLGLFSEKNGDVLVSAISFEKETLAKSGFSLDGAVNFVKGLTGSIFAGRIYRVTREGKVSMEARSVNLLLSMARIEDSPLIYSAYRLNIKYFRLSADVVLSVNVLRGQSLPVREMGWKTILPPYKFFPEITLL